MRGDGTLESKGRRLQKDLVLTYTTTTRGALAFVSIKDKTLGSITAKRI